MDKISTKSVLNTCSKKTTSSSVCLSVCISLPLSVSLCLSVSLSLGFVTHSLHMVFPDNEHKFDSHFCVNYISQPLFVFVNGNHPHSYFNIIITNRIEIHLIDSIGGNNWVLIFNFNILSFVKNNVSRFRIKMHIRNKMHIFIREMSFLHERPSCASLTYL